MSFDGLLKEEYKRLDTVSDEVLQESLQSLVQKVSSWFRRRRMEKFEYKFLTRGNDEFVYFVKGSGYFEAIHYDGNNIIGEHVFRNAGEMERFIKERMSEGFRGDTNARTSKNGIRILMALLGASIAIAGPWVLLGPSIVVVAGWLWEIIGTVSTFAWDIATNADLAPDEDPGIIRSIVQTAGRIFIAGTSVVAGWTIINLSLRDIEDDSSGPVPPNTQGNF